MLINWDFLLEVLFDLTLFFLLVIVFYKVFMQYILPFLYHQILDIKKHQKEVKNKIQLLDASQIRLESQIVDQKEGFDLLDEKVKFWHKSIYQNNKKFIQKHCELIEKIKAKRINQKEHFCLFKLEKNVIVQSIDQTYDSLSPINCKPRGRELLTELIDIITQPYLKVK